MTELEKGNYEEIVALGIATEEELNLVHALAGGTWTDTIDAVCYVRTGYRTFAQFYEEEIVEEEEY